MENRSPRSALNTADTLKKPLLTCHAFPIPFFHALPMAKTGRRCEAPAASGWVLRRETRYRDNRGDFLNLSRPRRYP
jgi:hypothetical protein